MQINQQKPKKFKIYMSHSIRGSDGDEATQQKRDDNCQMAINIGNLIDFQLANLGVLVEIYIPGRNEPFVGRAYEKGWLTEKQILDIDCKIISDCNLVLVWSPDGWKGGGIGVEIKHAEKQHIPVIVFEDITPKLIHQILEVYNAQKRDN